MLSVTLFHFPNWNRPANIFFISGKPPLITVRSVSDNESDQRDIIIIDSSSPGVYRQVCINYHSLPLSFLLINSVFHFSRSLLCSFSLSLFLYWVTHQWFIVASSSGGGFWGGLLQLAKVVSTYSKFFAHQKLFRMDLKSRVKNQYCWKKFLKPKFCCFLFVVPTLWASQVWEQHPQKIKDQKW